MDDGRVQEEFNYVPRELSRGAPRLLTGPDQGLGLTSYNPVFQERFRPPPSETSYGLMRPPPSFGLPEGYHNQDLRRRPSSVQGFPEFETRTRVSPTSSLSQFTAYPDRSDSINDVSTSTATNSVPHSIKPHHSQKRNSRDEFDGPTQFLKKPPTDILAAQERDLPHVPTNLDVREQDDVLSQVNKTLSRCAYDFVAKYQFPIPLEAGKRPVEQPSDREWTEWVYLLKRLATKRRIPARILYHGQIKQLVTVLENSLEMRHAAAHQSRPPKDDRNILQLISAGIQVAKILKDAATMESLDRLYQHTEKTIQQRKGTPLSCVK